MKNKIREITHYPPFDLLLKADPDPERIKEYCKKSKIFGIEKGPSVIGVIVLLPRRMQILEIMNISVEEQYQVQDLGKELLQHAVDYAAEKLFRKIVISTGNSSIHQLKLYQAMGFNLKKISKGFFVKHYNHYIMENDLQCRHRLILEYRLFREGRKSRMVRKLWKRYVREEGADKSTPYEVWSFGGNEYLANKLMHLVRIGKKTGTSSLKILYEKDGDPVPREGDISVITYGNGKPGCIIRTIRVLLKPFSEISEKEAELEGEGDLSLAYWRSVHEEVFTEELAQYGEKFSEDSIVVYEIFDVIYDILR